MSNPYYSVGDEAEKLRAENERLYKIIDEKIESVGELVIQVERLRTTQDDLQEALSEAASALGRDRGRRNETIAQRITAIRADVERLREALDWIIAEPEDPIKVQLWARAALDGRPFERSPKRV